MIISASYRTDIPAFYGDWFQARLAAGHAMVRNPYSGARIRVGLGPEEVSGFVFWSKNLAPFWPALEELAVRRMPFLVSYSILDYPRALERAVPDAERHVEILCRLAGRFGPRVAVWRYDPVLLSDLTPPAWHRARFARLARALAGATDEVVLSFAQIYAKTRRNLDQASVAWRDPDAEEKRALLAELAAIAAAHGMRASLCSQPELLGPGLQEARCIDAARLSDVAGRPIAAREKGNRPGCRCAESRDIGAYDSCPHGCVYCYAVAGAANARARFSAHDPAAAEL